MQKTVVEDEEIGCLNMENIEVKKTNQIIDLSEPQNIVELIKSAEEDLSSIEQHLSAHIKKLIGESKLSDYTILFLYQPYKSIDESVANKIYASLEKNPEQKLLMVLNSPGGRVEPAYLLSKCCIEHSTKFVVSVPRKAKSAATLIALGAQEIHMGSMSELGPIDPQFGGLPALGLSSALERLATLSTNYPQSGDMFAKYLADKLDLRILGYFERVSESTVQYAQRLLSHKCLPNKETPQSVANKLVYSFKDHSFVIDKEEARLLLGEHIKTDTPEYDFGNKIHQFLDFVDFFTNILKNKHLSLIGNVNGFSFYEKDDD